MALGFSYNSIHKLITAGIVVLAVIVIHYTTSGDELHYPNGQLKRSGAKKGSLNHGRWVWWYENGQVEMEGSFVNGKREGLWTTYDKLGNKRSEGMYKNDKLNGKYIEYRPNGEKKVELYYKDDHVIDHQQP